MPKRKISYGIVGAGIIADTHANALAMSKNSKLTAVYDRDPRRSRDFAAKYKVKSFNSLEAFLKDREIDVVTIAVPSGLHAEIAIPAANAGKHILCEKPLDINIEKAESIINACRRNKVLLSTVFQLRLSPEIQKIKRVLSKGLFGKIIHISARIKWFRSQEYYDSVAWRGAWAIAGGGALMTQGIHDLDLLLYLNGNPVEVCAFTGTLTHTGIEVEDNAVVSVRWPNGSLGTIEASTSCNPPFPRRLEITGERGSVVLEDGKIIRWDLQDGNTEVSGSFPGGGTSDPASISSQGHCQQIEELSEAILNGSQVLSLPGEEGLRSIRFINAVYESAGSGKVVTFNRKNTLIY
ncbi:MAG: Gfo/Idh/MocA family oxidoreductase [Victivallales bacterium]